MKQGDQQRFDQLASVVWDLPEIAEFNHRENHNNDLYYFQELIQNLVKPRDGHRPALLRDRSIGSRLRNLQRRREHGKCRSTVEYPTLNSADASFQSIGSVLGRLTMDDEPAYDNFDLADFIHIDRLQGEPLASEGAYVREFLHSMLGAPWKQVDSAVVLMLASVAFTVVLMVISGASFLRGLGWRAAVRWSTVILTRHSISRPFK